MYGLRAFLPVALALCLVLPASVAFAQQPPPNVTVFEKRFDVVDPPAQADVLQVVLDFAPGAWSPLHMHPSPSFVTVIDGSVTLRMDGTDTVLKAGESWQEQLNKPHAAGNDSATPARLVVTFVLARGAVATTVVESGAQVQLPPGPTAVVQGRFETTPAAGPLEIVQRLTDIPPAGVSPPHTHPGPNFVSSLAGEVTLSMQGTSQTYKALESWQEPANVVHSGANNGNVTTRLATSTLVPKGAAVATPAQAAAPAAPQAAPAQPAAAQPAAAQAAPAQTPRQLPRTGLPLEALPIALIGLALLISGGTLRRTKSLTP